MPRNDLAMALSFLQNDRAAHYRANQKDFVFNLYLLNAIKQIIHKVITGYGRIYHQTGFR